MALRKAYSPGTPVPFHGMWRTEKVIGPSSGVSILASDLVAGGQVALFTIPAGFVLVGLRIDSAQLDSSGSPTLTASLGDAANNARFLSASTAFRAATPNVTSASLGVAGYQFPADTDLLLTFPAAAATPAPGTITAFAVGYLNA